MLEESWHFEIDPRTLDLIVFKIIHDTKWYVDFFSSGGDACKFTNVFANEICFKLKGLKSWQDMLVTGERVIWSRKPLFPRIPVA